MEARKERLKFLPLPVLAVNTYPKKYIDECYSRMDAQLAAYKTLV